MTWDDRLAGWVDAAMRWMAYHLPRRIVYWALVRAWVFGTSGKWAGLESTSVLMRDVAQRYRTGEH